MGLEINWRSEQGQRSKNNRDHGGVGLREGSALCIVLDGSSSGNDSGEFARLIARTLIEWFVATEEVTTDTIIDRLRGIHADLSPKFRQDSASFVIALIEESGAVLFLHAGDCLAGVSTREAGIDWRTRPHTLANPIDEVAIKDIAQSPLRNRITRSFRSKEFATPATGSLTLTSDDTLMLATDGFWAALDLDAQSRFLAAMTSPFLTAEMIAAP